MQYFKLWIGELVVSFFDVTNSLSEGNNTWNWKVLEERFDQKELSTRDRPRFFDQVGHQTTNASIENKILKKRSRTNIESIYRRLSVASSGVCEELKKKFWKNFFWKTIFFFFFSFSFLLISFWGKIPGVLWHPQHPCYIRRWYRQSSWW